MCYFYIPKFEGIAACCWCRLLIRLVRLALLLLCCWFWFVCIPAESSLLLVFAECIKFYKQSLCCCGVWLLSPSRELLAPATWMGSACIYLWEMDPAICCDMLLCIMVWLKLAEETRCALFLMGCCWSHLSSYCWLGDTNFAFTYAINLGAVCYILIWFDYKKAKVNYKNISHLLSLNFSKIKV